MQQIGIVESKIGNRAEVRIARASACGEHCASCKGGCTPTEKVVVAEDRAGAKPGDRVILAMGSGRVLLAAFLVYILPLFFLIGGYLAAAQFTKGEFVCILSGLAAMGICFVIVSRIDKRVKEKYCLFIEKIL